MRTYTHVVHDLTPVYDEHSRILILGSLPSVKSRGQFFYNHPQNRFWKVLAVVTDNRKASSVVFVQQVCYNLNIRCMKMGTRTGL